MNLSSLRHSRGFSLIEVMIAVVVLSFGLLALAALQTNLFRAGAETKARANATAMAQQIIEEAKGFAYVAPPAGFTGATYTGITTANLGNQSIGGVTYSVCRQVRRYRLDTATNRFVALNGVDAAGCADTGTVAAAFNPAVAEFKEVRVNVSWQDESGAAKTVELNDSIAAIAPADAARIVATPTDGSRGPEVWIVPPNKDNPQVVPIAIGGDQSTASSNPKPEQFIQDVSAATLFSVQTFTGSSAGDEVKLNRKLDVAAVSCVCQNGTAVSSASNPAYQATQWSGKQLAYLEPLALPAGTPIATAVVSNADSEVAPMCTVCCRDHHQAAARNPKPDPYRTFADGESEHYGYKQQGNSYNVGAGLFAVGADTGNKYVDACQLIRVNGRMRMAVDAQLNNLLVTPLNDATTAYRNTNFINRYSGYVSDTIAAGMTAIPSGYPGPVARFPTPTDSVLATYDDIVNPAALAVVTGDTRKLVAFGLYVDYINADTKQAYNCAGKPSGTAGCDGLTNRNPLEVLPLYAVNVANLGSWSSARAGVVSVVNATYSNRGLLASDGGVVTAQSSSAAEPVNVTIDINQSNSGLAGTSAVDPDDNASMTSDLHAFTKTSGTQSGTRNSLFIKVGSTSTLTLSSVLVTSPAGGTQCTYAKKSLTSTCRFDSPATSLTVGLANFTTMNNKGVITNRKLCVPAHTKVVLSQTNTGLTDETATITLSNLAAVDYTLTIDIVDQASLCPTGTSPMIP